MLTFIIFIGIVLYEIKIRKTIFLAMKINTFCNFNSPKLGQLETKWAENWTLDTVQDADTTEQ